MIFSFQLIIKLSNTKNIDILYFMYYLKETKERSWDKSNFETFDIY